MTLLFDPAAVPATPVPAGLPDRRARGRMAHLSGAAAEGIVERHYTDSGATVLARRWRGQQGEIDLVLRDDSGLVFVEVKAAAGFDRAIASLRPVQMARICGAAEEFAGTQPDGLLSCMRFDLAAVDGHGQVKVLENAFGEF